MYQEMFSHEMLTFGDFCDNVPQRLSQGMLTCRKQPRFEILANWKEGNSPHTSRPNAVASIGKRQGTPRQALGIGFWEVGMRLSA